MASVAALAALAAAGALYQNLATRRDLAATPPPGTLVSIGTHRLHLWCTGSGSPTVVLEGGLGGSAFSWAAVQSRVATFTRVCSYDRAGLGYSDSGPMPRTSARIAGELARLLDGAHITQPVVLAGASLGGFAARILATTQPQRVSGLVLVDASHEDQQQRLRAVGVNVDAPPAFGAVVRLASVGFLRIRNQTLGLDPEGAETSVRPFVRATVHRTSRYQALYSETASFAESAAEVRATRRTLTMPLIVLTAGAWPDEGRDIHTELQHDQLALSSRSCQIVVEGAGHALASEAPSRVADAIRIVATAPPDGALSCESRR